MSLISDLNAQALEDFKRKQQKLKRKPKIKPESKEAMVLAAVVDEMGKKIDLHAPPINRR